MQHNPGCEHWTDWIHVSCKCYAEFSPPSAVHSGPKPFPAHDCGRVHHPRPDDHAVGGSGSDQHKREFSCSLEPSTVKRTHCTKHFNGPGKILRTRRISCLRPTMSNVAKARVTPGQLRTYERIWSRQAKRHQGKTMRGCWNPRRAWRTCGNNAARPLHP